MVFRWHQSRSSMRLSASPQYDRFLAYTMIGLLLLLPSVIGCVDDHSERERAEPRTDLFVGPHAPTFSAMPLPESPNVIVILADDLGVDLVGAYRNLRGIAADGNAESRVETPNLDQLASDGMVFVNAWTNPGCSPSRAQVLTGLHSRRTGIGGIVNWSVQAHQPMSPGLSHDAPLLPQKLRNSVRPYDTAAVGKWHLGSPSQGALHALGPNEEWFHRWAGSPFNLNGDGIGYRYWPKTFATQIGDDDECGPPYPCIAMMDESKSCGAYATVDTAEDAVRLMRSMREPFFLYVAFNAPHTPLDLPRCDLAETCQGTYSVPNTRTVTERTNAMVSVMDHEIGRIMCEVDHDDTIVFFIGDNGTASDPSAMPGRGNNLVGHRSRGKATLYNSGINVPLIVWGAGVAPGRSDALVNSTDLYATVLELAGVVDVAPARADSVSLVPYLQVREHPRARRTIHAERFTPTYTPVEFRTGTPPVGYASKQHRRAIRNARFKLIERHERGKSIEEEFFDLLEGGNPDTNGNPTNDYLELNNLILSRSDWSRGGEIEENYWALKQELSAVLPALP